MPSSIRFSRKHAWTAAVISAAALAFAGTARADYRDRAPEDEVIYFVMPDRFENADPANDTGGIPGGPLKNGFNPKSKGFYHGGDLRGLTQRLDYIQGLGVTAIWVTPVFKNKAVQGPPGDESAAYHGYWITDFTDIDPHLGTRADFKAFVDAAHARGMKVYLDIVINHTADVIRYRECPKPSALGCPYRSKADYPYSTRGGVGGAKINKGFLGDEIGTEANFAKLSRPDYAYTPYVPEAEKDVKRPAWLNELRYYHNRGNSTFQGESSNYGDFFGLDDVYTENPKVVQGFIDIYGRWISDFKLDGFRIDTEQHVGAAFWRAFIPAMLQKAKESGVPHFYIFGEVMNMSAAVLAEHSRVDGLPYPLDFAFMTAIKDVVAKGAPTDELSQLFAADSLYEGGATHALGLPTFLGNHDLGRFGYFLRQADPEASADELLKKDELGLAMLFFLRGVPVIYYGDEQGFTGDGGDQDAREDMLPSQVASYNDNVLIGTNKTTADSNFDTNSPLYKLVSDFAKIYREHPTLRRGKQLVRLSEIDGGLFAVSRMGADGGEILEVFNTRNETRRAEIEVDPRSTQWTSLVGTCDRRPSAPGSYHVRLQPFGYVICQSNKWRLH